MKLCFQLSVSVAIVIALSAVSFSQQAPEALTRDQVTDLVQAGMETPALVKLIHEHGIDFDLTDDYVQSLKDAGAKEPVIEALHQAPHPSVRDAKPEPLTRDSVLKLVASGVPSVRTAAAIRQRGIDFLPDEAYFDTLRLAGANDEIIGALRETTLSELIVTTSPNAEIYLDSELKGHANAQGEFTVKPEAGNHALKVTLAGKKDFERSIYLRPRETNKMEVRLEEM